jgi:hypothetical protein
MTERPKVPDCKSGGSYPAWVRIPLVSPKMFLMIQCPARQLVWSAAFQAVKMGAEPMQGTI